jgi:hypothetical protein
VTAPATNGPQSVQGPVQGESATRVTSARFAISNARPSPCQGGRARFSPHSPSRKSAQPPARTTLPSTPDARPSVPRRRRLAHPAPCLTHCRAARHPRRGATPTPTPRGVRVREGPQSDRRVTAENRGAELSEANVWNATLRPLTRHQRNEHCLDALAFAATGEPTDRLDDLGPESPVKGEREATSALPMTSRTPSSHNVAVQVGPGMAAGPVEGPRGGAGGGEWGLLSGHRRTSAIEPLSRDRAGRHNRSRPLRRSGGGRAAAPTSRFSPASLACSHRVLNERDRCYERVAIVTTRLSDGER